MTFPRYIIIFIVLLCAGVAISGKSVSFPVTNPSSSFFIPEEKGVYISPCSLRIVNTGNTPLLACIPEVNGKGTIDAAFFTALRRSSKSKEEYLDTLYSYMCQHVAHGSTFLPHTTDPYYMLNCTGTGLCSDQMLALMQLCGMFGIPIRQVPLNGHVTGEAFTGAKWRMIDTDRQVWYPGLLTLKAAGHKEILRDPFLALRVKASSKNAPFHFARSAANAALFEHILPYEIPPGNLKNDFKAWYPHQRFDLHSGESILFTYGVSPQRAVGHNPDPQLAEKLSSVILTIVPHVRQVSESLTIRTPYPVAELHNGTTDTLYFSRLSRVCAPRQTVDFYTTPTFALQIHTKAAAGVITVICQMAKNALPPVFPGRNTFRLSSPDSIRSVGLSVKLAYSSSTGYSAPAAPSASREFDHVIPTFTIPAPKLPADSLQWRILAAGSTVPAPNLTSVQAFSATISLDYLQYSFLPSHTDFLFQYALKNRDTHWSPWSSAHLFTISRPPAIKACSFRYPTDSTVQLNWNHVQPEAKYLVFGSHAKDFIPEVYGPFPLISEMINDSVVSQTNPSNHILATKDTCIELPDTCTFFRIICQYRQCLSLPSPLLHDSSHLSPLFAVRLSKGQHYSAPLSRCMPKKATILQTFWKKVGDTTRATGYRDIYHARRVPLYPPVTLAHPPVLVEGDGLTGEVHNDSLILEAEKTGRYRLIVCSGNKGTYSWWERILNKIILVWILRKPYNYYKKFFTMYLFKVAVE